jgi:HPt (histidine-containing phosphotransfer) domain-containing protein
MAPEEKPSLEDKVRALRERYADSVDDKINEISVSYKALLAANKEGDLAEQIDALIAPVHKMAGSAPTFGLMDLGACAAELEAALVSFKSDSKRLSEEEISKITVLTEALCQARKTLEG